MTCGTQHRFSFLSVELTNFDLSDELAGLQRLKGTMTGEDIFVKLCKTMSDLELDWEKLRNVINDGASCMTD